jgi:hypothetical protein
MSGRWTSEEKYQLAGWGLFIICAVLFLLSSINAKDGLMITASLVFLVACFVFLAPYFNKQS